MVHYSVLIPGRNATERIARLLGRLCPVFDNLVLPYELIAIDDATSDPAEGSPEELLYEYPALRVLRFDQVRGISASLSAGIAAARGELIIAIDPQARFGVECIPNMISRLGRHDLVTVEAEPTASAELVAPLARIPRWLSADPQLLPTENLLWAARREAVYGLALARGAFRVLPQLVQRRGFRVCRLRLSPGLPPQGSTVELGTLERMITAWFDRRFEPHLARELTKSDAAHTRLRLARPSRVERARLRPVPSPLLTPQEADRGESV